MYSKLVILKFSVFFLFSPVILFSQEKNISGIDGVAGEWIKNIRAASKEKTLLRTDKNIYGATDTIWFKAYVVDSVSGKLITKKGILYIDLVDMADHPVTRLFLRADRVQTTGMIVLSDSIHSGYYWLRSYSGIQPGKKVSNASNISVIPLMIINPRKSLPGVLVPSTTNSDNAISSEKMLVKIFPEGGAYMSGTNNNVIVKIQDGHGNPLAVSGVIKDVQANEVASFTTNNSGLGRFIFSPTPRGKYNLFVKNDRGYDSIMALPKVNMHAAQISVVEQNEQAVKVKVMLEDSLYTSNYTSYIMAISRDSLCFAAVGQGMYQLNIPLHDFPSGIAHLLLFNDKGLLLAGRDIYLQKRIPNVSISATKNNFGPREKVNMDINVTDASGNPMFATLSVSVTDSRLSDTSSKIFETPLEQESFQDIDMMMITNQNQSWSSNTGVTLSNHATNLSVNPFVYEGELVNAHQKPLENYEIFMISNKGNLILLKDTTDINGHFKIPLPEFDGRMEYNIKVSNLHGSNDEYVIVPEHVQFPPVATPNALKNIWFDWQQLLAKKVREKRLDTVFLMPEKGTLPAVTVSKKISKSNSEPSYVLTQEMLLQNGMNTVGLALLSVPGVHFSMGYLVIGGPVAFTSSATDEPLVVMDGVPAQLDMDGAESPLMRYLNAINVRDIEYIKVLTGSDASIYGLRGGHGVIEIKSTSKGSQGKPGKDDIKVFLNGYHVPVPFIDPDYDNKELNKKMNADSRSTRFWNSDLVTDKTGKASFHFYTGDKETSYFVTVAGITLHGEKIFKSILINRN